MGKGESARWEGVGEVQTARCLPNHVRICAKAVCHNVTALCVVGMGTQQRQGSVRARGMCSYKTGRRCVGRPKAARKQGKENVVHQNPARFIRHNQNKPEHTHKSPTTNVMFRMQVCVWSYQQKNVQHQECIMLF